MYCIVEITYYPLHEDYTSPILDFIERIRSEPAIESTVGETSTVVRGEFQTVMGFLTREMGREMEKGTRTSFVLKILNTES